MHIKDGVLLIYINKSKNIIFFNGIIIFLLSRHQSQIMATCQGTQIVYFTMRMPTRGDLIS
jgi:hypothetical protein